MFEQSVKSDDSGSMADARVIENEKRENEKRIWLLKRNCALSPRQVVTFYFSLVILSALIGTGFALFGAWLVLPFAGLEMLAVGIALYIYARHATDHERVVLEQGSLLVETVVAGKRSAIVLNPHWSRVMIENGRRGFGGARQNVFLSEQGRFVPIGRYVNAGQRSLFVQELKRALKSA